MKNEVNWPYFAFQQCLVLSGQLLTPANWPTKTFLTPYNLKKNTQVFHDFIEFCLIFPFTTAFFLHGEQHQEIQFNFFMQGILHSGIMRRKI